MEKIQPFKIEKCLKKAGILMEQIDVSSVGEDIDPFKYLDAEIYLNRLIFQNNGHWVPLRNVLLRHIFIGYHELYT